MKKYFSVIFLSALMSFNAFADTPGKATMYDSQISFQNIEKFAEFNFYWKRERVDQPQLITKDISVSMESTHGAPTEYYFWAVNKVTQKSTDTIEFHNYYAPDYVIILNSINDSIRFTKKELSNKMKLLPKAIRMILQTSNWLPMLKKPSGIII